MCDVVYSVFFFQAEDGIRDLVRSRGLGDVYKRQGKPGMDALGKLGENLPPVADVVGANLARRVLAGAADKVDGGGEGGRILGT